MQVFMPTQHPPIDKEKKKIMPFNLTKSPSGKSPDNSKENGQSGTLEAFSFSNFIIIYR
jgi:hypothetical protein